MARLLLCRLVATTAFVLDAESFLFGAGAAASGAAALYGVALSKRPPGLADIWVRPGASQFGVGLVAIRPVPARTRICRCEADHVSSVPRSTLITLPAAVRRTIHELYDGFEPDGSCQVPTDYDQSIPLIAFINHADEPNCAFDEEAHSIVTLRPLATGEEATVNYFSYQEEYSWTYQHAAAGFPA